jgi:hypothetical protein
MEPREQEPSAAEVARKRFGFCDDVEGESERTNRGSRRALVDRSARRVGWAVLGGEPVVQRGGQGNGLVDLDQVPGGVDELQARVGDEIGEAVSAIDGDPGVVLSPDDQDGKIKLGVARLDLVGVGLIGLSDLAIERLLTVGSEPRCDEHVRLCWGETRVAGAGDVSTDGALVYGGRKSAENVGMLVHQGASTTTPTNASDA